MKNTTRVYAPEFWPKEMPEADRTRSMDDFSAAIYPIWKGIEEKDNAKDQALSLAEAGNRLMMSEVLTLHKQDLAIFQSGIKVRRDVMTVQTASDFRRKQAASDKFTRWQSGE